MTAVVDASIIAYRNRREIADCVRRALAIPGVGRVIVVDHGDDGSGEIARAAGAIVVSDPTNPGFGAGHNRAARMSQAPYLLLLNPDALVVRRAVRAGVDLLVESPQVVAVQGTILGRDGRPERSQGIALGPQHLLGRALGARALLRSRLVRTLARHLHSLRDHVERAPDTATIVESLAATALLVRRAAFDRVGGFDEGFFLYGEDVDLCSRLRQAGGELVAVPTVWARHRGGGSFGRSWDREVEWWRGSMRLAATSWDAASWATARAAALITFLRLASRRPSQTRAAWRALVSDPRRVRRGGTPPRGVGARGAA